MKKIKVILSMAVALFLVGTVSAIPDYDVWGEKQVHVNGRIWIKVR